MGLEIAMLNDEGLVKGKGVTEMGESVEVGSFISSYNEYSYSLNVERMVGKGLYDIFDPEHVAAKNGIDDDNLIIYKKEDLQRALDVANYIKTKLRSESIFNVLEITDGSFDDVQELIGSGKSNLPVAKEALQWLKEANRKKDPSSVQTHRIINGQHVVGWLLDQPIHLIGNFQSYDSMNNRVTYMVHVDEQGELQYADYVSPETPSRVALSFEKGADVVNEIAGRYKQNEHGRGTVHKGGVSVMYQTVPVHGIVYGQNLIGIPSLLALYKVEKEELSAYLNNTDHLILMLKEGMKHNQIKIAWGE